MSKHYFRRSTKNGIFQIHIGWDNQTEEYFCSIFTVDSSTDIPDFPMPEWSTLFEPAILPTIQRIEGKCKEFGIDIPNGLIDEVRKDSFTGAIRNRIVNWDE